MKGSFRPLLLWTLAVWLPLFAACYAATRSFEEQEVWTLVLIGGLLLAAVCFARALVAIRSLHFAGRIVWWFVTASALCLTAVFFVGQFEMWTYGFNHDFLTLAWLLPALGLLFVWVRIRMTRESRVGFEWLADATMAIGLLAIVFAACSVGFALRVSRLEHESDERWMAIGRPPAQFLSITMKAQAENDSITALREDLRAFGCRTMYRDHDYPAPAIPDGVLSVITADRQPADALKLEVKSDSFLEVNGELLAGIYSRILSREPPRWALKPEEVPLIRVPNYPMLRQFAQIATADALLRISHGDFEGAEAAVLAVQRVNEGVWEHPILISRMIHVAVDACTSGARCRLPTTDGEWNRLAEKTARMRDGIRGTMQVEGCALSDWARHSPPEAFKPEGILPKGFQSLPWPSSFRRKAAAAWIRHESAISSSGHSEVVRLSMQPAHFASDDLGRADFAKVEQRFKSSTWANFSRSWTRTNLTLVLDEEVELIRQARMWLDKDRNDVPQRLTSQAIPGTTWVIELDRNARTLRLTLDGAPEWVTKSPEGGEGFFPLPPDGSATWQFAPKSKSVAAKSVR